MLNVIDFRKRAPRSSESRAQPAAASTNVDIAELASRIVGLQSQANWEIGHAILMLDRAVAHAGEIAKRARDPAVRKDFDEQVAIIDELLQIARKTALKL